MPSNFVAVSYSKLELCHIIRAVVSKNQWTQPKFADPSMDAVSPYSKRSMTLTDWTMTDECVDS